MTISTNPTMPISNPTVVETANIEAPGANKPYVQAWGAPSIEIVGGYNVVQKKKFSTSCKVCCVLGILACVFAVLIIGALVGVLVYIFYPKQPTIGMKFSVY
jgi:hypothetical protein